MASTAAGAAAPAASDHAAKWEAYYESAAPWDSGKPASQLQEACDGGTLPAVTSVEAPSTIELGCGTGASTVYLAREWGALAVGVDIVESALHVAYAKAKEAGVEVTAHGFEPPAAGSGDGEDSGSAGGEDAGAGGRRPGGHVHLVKADILSALSGSLSEAGLPATYDFLFDCQVYHALLHVADNLPVTMASLLKPIAGHSQAMVMAGNASQQLLEPGPTVLAASALVSAFEGLPCGRGPSSTDDDAVQLCVESLRTSHFDATEAYASARHLPLAWVLLLKAGRMHRPTPRE